MNCNEIHPSLRYIAQITTELTSVRKHVGVIRLCATIRLYI